MDRAGRVVIPKEVRCAAGLKPGDAIEVAFREGAVVIEPAGSGMHLEKRGRFTVLVPDVPIENVDENIVQKTIAQLREERIEGGKGL